MRWIDKPRKKTRREIVLEYIKFMKIMGYYNNLVAYMYESSRRNPDSIIYLCGRYYSTTVFCHNQFMIAYFENVLKRYCYNKVEKRFIMVYFIKYPLKITEYEAKNITDLLFSYFKEKHIDNCIIVD